MRRVLTAGMALTVAACLMGTASASARPLTPQGTDARVKVKIVSFAFNPQTVNVVAGDVVIWTNTASISHTSTSDTGKWDSGVLAPGAKFKHRFKKPGTFTYHCSIHPSMTASVVVSP